MLDTFAKRLNSQGYASPGDIDKGDRWAAADHFRPTDWQAGAIAAALGAVVLAAVGTSSGGGSANYEFADRVRIEETPYPGDLSIENRYAIAGHFLFAGTSASAIEATLGGLTASLVGTFTPVNTNGTLSAQLGALQAALVGESYYDLFYDVEYSLTPAFGFQEIPAYAGAVSATLGSVTSLILGTALPPDSVSGYISSALDSLSSSLVGTLTAPTSVDGRLHGDLSALRSGLRGTAVDPGGNIGAVRTTVGGLGSELLGTFTGFLADGYISASLGAVGASWFGQVIEAGADVGLISGDLGALAVSLRGLTSAPDAGYLVGTVRFRPALDATIVISPAIEGEPRIYPV